MRVQCLDPSHSARTEPQKLRRVRDTAHVFAACAAAAAIALLMDLPAGPATLELMVCMSCWRGCDRASPCGAAYADAYAMSVRVKFGWLRIL